MSISFSSLNLDDALTSSLGRIGIVEPSPIQYNFIKSFVKETSIIFQSKSGTGKTVSFSIALLNKIISRKKLENQGNRDIDHTDGQINNDLDVLFGDGVIIVPTRELAFQIYLFFRSLVPSLPLIKLILITGGSNMVKAISYMKSHNVNVIISTPGRFKAIIKSKPSKTEVSNLNIKSNQDLFRTHLIVFDEADMLLDEQFFEQTKYICNKICSPFVQVIAVSATFLKPQFKSFQDMVWEADQKYIDKFKKNTINYIKDDKVNGDLVLNYHANYLMKSKSISQIKELEEYVYSFERNFEKMILSTSYLNRMIDSNSGVTEGERVSIFTETTETLEGVSEMSSTSLVLEHLDFYMGTVIDAPNIVSQIGLKIEMVYNVLESVKYNKCIIFCNQSHTRIQTYKLLMALGHPCYINSSRVSPKERIQMLMDLATIDKVVILCTDLISRGIGFTNVDLVINMDMPSSKESFLHRSGRTGRFGSKGICVSVCMESEVETYEYFEFSLNFKSKPVEKIPEYKKIDLRSKMMKSVKVPKLLDQKKEFSEQILPTFPFSVLVEESPQPKEQQGSDGCKIGSLLEGLRRHFVSRHVEHWKNLIKIETNL